MTTSKPLLPAIKAVCIKCPYFRRDEIFVNGSVGGEVKEVDTEIYWLCGAADETLFFEVPEEAKDCGGIIELETELPPDCPYTLEQTLNQTGAGRERWEDLTPLLKMKPLTIIL